MSIKRNIFYFSMIFIFCFISLYYLNHTNTGIKNYNYNNNNNILDNITLDPKKFIIPDNNNIIKKQNSYEYDFCNKNNKSSFSENDIIALFSPRDNIRKTIIDYINAEKEGIICAAFRLTDPLITKAFLLAAERGIKLTFIIDKEGLSSMHSKALNILNIGVPVYIYPPITSLDNALIQGLMHNKIILLVSQKIILTGSFNFTKSAQDKNRENIIVIKNNNNIFNQYFNELQFLMTESTKFQNNQIKMIKKNKKIYKKKIKNKK